MEATWELVKNFATTYQVSIQWVDVGNLYFLKAFQGQFEVQCYLLKDGGADQIDFETNYKPSGNQTSPAQTVVQGVPPYGSKTIVINNATKKLFARFTGIQSSVSTGDNTITYTATYPWSKILGVEVINCEALDTADLKVFDTAAGTYSGTPNALLNQFAFAINLPKDFYQRMAQFDADLYQGMIIQITYNSKSNKTIGINFLLDEVKS